METIALSKKMIAIPELVEMRFRNHFHIFKLSEAEKTLVQIECNEQRDEVPNPCPALRMVCRKRLVLFGMSFGLSSNEIIEYVKSGTLKYTWK